MSGVSEEKLKVSSDIGPQSKEMPAMASEVESLQNEMQKCSALVNDLSSSLHDLQVWVVGAIQRETEEVKMSSLISMY